MEARPPSGGVKKRTAKPGSRGTDKQESTDKKASEAASGASASESQPNQQAATVSTKSEQRPFRCWRLF